MMEPIGSAVYVEVVQSLSKKLSANYIFPDVAEHFCPCQQKHLAEGDYTDITEGDLFALALTMP